MTVSAELFRFLSELKAANNREWFNAHKTEFKILEDEVRAFYKLVEQGLSEHDMIQSSKAYRIYRDIRFSKDKTPYKTYVSANFTRQKPALRGGYYLHLEPGGNSFIGVGFWKPDKKELTRVRKEWALDDEEIRGVITQKEFVECWGEMRGQTLKTAPRGFDRNHPAIDLINHKQWIFQHKFTDQQVLSADFNTRIQHHFKAIRPFFDYMSAVLTTDLNGISLLEDDVY